MDYIRSQLVDEDKAGAPKVTLMVGHDSNIASLLSALQVKPYTLPGNDEKTPIGGQVVFERWHDGKNNKDLLKIEYVYQTADQLRNADVLSLKNPPKRVTLQLAGCDTDANGYCSWEQFSAALNSALQGTPMQPAAVQEAKPQQAADSAPDAKAAAEKPADDNAKAKAEQAAADKAKADAAADKAAADKAKADAAAEKTAADKAKADKAAADKAAADKAKADKAAEDKAKADAAAAQNAQPEAASGKPAAEAKPAQQPATAG